VGSGTALIATATLHDARTNYGIANGFEIWVR